MRNPEYIIKPLFCTLLATLYPMFIQYMYEDTYKVKVVMPGWIHFAFVAAFFLLARQAYWLLFEGDFDGQR